MKLPRAFYVRHSLDVAPDLIGKVLVHRTAEGETAGRIVETEAYRGPEDRAAHSHGGRRTKRTEAMYLPGGHVYVFFLYGMHWAFNVVCAAQDAPEAVLVRAVEPLRGIELMAARRGVDAARRELTSGPGRLAEAFGVDKTAYGVDLCGDDLFLEDGPARAAVRRSARINVDYAGAHARRRWRFYERGNPYISVRPRD